MGRNTSTESPLSYAKKKRKNNVTISRLIAICQTVSLFSKKRFKLRRKKLKLIFERDVQNSVNLNSSKLFMHDK